MSSVGGGSLRWLRASVKVGGLRKGAVACLLLKQVAWENKAQDTHLVCRSRHLGSWFIGECRLLFLAVWEQGTQFGAGVLHPGGPLEDCGGLCSVECCAGQ